MTSQITITADEADTIIAALESQARNSDHRARLQPRRRGVEAQRRERFLALAARLRGEADAKERTASRFRRVSDFFRSYGVTAADVRRAFGGRA